jgi:DNA polymerase-1
MVAVLRRAGVGRGDPVALALAPGGLGLAVPGGDPISCAAGDPPAAVGALEEALRPRWVMWSGATALALVRSGIRVATCWDIAAVHRVLFGGWRSDPAEVWAQLHDLAPDAIPSVRPADLFGGQDDGDGPVRADGYLRPEWVEGGWSSSPDHLGRWAQLAATVAAAQQERLAALGRLAATALARYESTAELLCAELSTDGLPMDRSAAEAVIAGFIGPRPASPAEAAARRTARDAEVLRHAPPGLSADLRSPAQVRALLAGVGVDLIDTRAWRLQAQRHSHPLVEAILAWRKAERIATTYGYAWLDRHLGPDGRLRGEWSGSDGAAGRMTASGGLHNMPAEMRAAVIAEPGHTFVRADLGQIEPRVLAAVSTDAALARASQEDDMYAPVAEQLGVDRATAKVAVLGAMYGQTTGRGGQMRRRLDAAYPVAMAYLSEAARAGEDGRNLRTYGGRVIPMGSGGVGATRRDDPARAAARGRYGRNAMIQGAAAELFKLWAVTVRARGEPLAARIVLCLHDELLVQVPVRQADAAAGVVAGGLREAAWRWAPDDSVRFVADITIVDRWADAKNG